MYKISLTGHLAHDAVFFNSVCKTCNKLNSGVNDTTVSVLCSKCGAPLQPLVDKNKRPMSISECTVYPSRSSDEQKQLDVSTKRRKNGMLPVYRFTLFSFTDKNGTLNPHPLHKYLAKGRRVFLEFHHEPVISFFNSKDPDFPIQCEIKFVYLDGKDTIELQDKKKEIVATVSETQYPVAVIPQKEADQSLPKPDNPYSNLTINELCSIDPMKLDGVHLSLLNQAVLAKSVNTQQEKEQAASVGGVDTTDFDIGSIDGLKVENDPIFTIPEDDIPF